MGTCRSIIARRILHAPNRYTSYGLNLSSAPSARRWSERAIQQSSGNWVAMPYTSTRAPHHNLLPVLADKCMIVLTKQTPDTRWGNNDRSGSVAASQHCTTWAAVFECLPAARQPIFKSRESERLLSSIAAAQWQCDEGLVTARRRRSRRLILRLLNYGV